MLNLSKICRIHVHCLHPAVIWLNLIYLEISVYLRICGSTLIAKSGKVCFCLICFNIKYIKKLETAECSEKEDRGSSKVIKLSVTQCISSEAKIEPGLIF